MYPGIELRVMRYIVAVAQELHFTRAADRVHIAQPSMSKQIRLVEGDLGVELFHRTRRKVEITEPGKAFVENAEQALLYAERAVASARAASAGRQGKLILGVSPAIDQRIYFRIEDVYRKEYPAVEVCYQSCFANQQAEWILRNDLHAGLMELPIRCHGLSVMSLTSSPILLAVSARSQLAKIKALSPQDLKEYELVLLSQETDLARKQIEESLRTWGYRPGRIVEVANASQALDFVLAGRAISALREYLVDLESKAIVFHRVPELAVTRVGLAYHRNNQSPALKNLLLQVRSMFVEERKKMLADKHAKN